MLILVAPSSVSHHSFSLSYILRIATVAKQTLAIGPFVLEESDADTNSSDR